MKPFYLYMLRCKDGSYYIGHTDELEKRIAEHEAGTHRGYTYERRPVTLVFVTEFETRDEALQREMQMKNWSRAKKEALARGEWDLLKQLSRGPDRKDPSTTPGLRPGYARGERGRAEPEDWPDYAPSERGHTAEPEDRPGYARGERGRAEPEDRPGYARGERSRKGTDG